MSDTTTTSAPEAGPRAESGERDVPARPFVHVLALKLDPAWRRLSEERKAEERSAFLEAHREASERVTTYTYSMVGTRADASLLYWRLGETFEDVEETAARLLRSGMGRWLDIGYVMTGLVRPSSYVKERTPQEEAMFTGERSRYIIVYPFVKTTEWYLLPDEERRLQMAEHIRVGRKYPAIAQLLAYSFGVDDQEFIVAYETESLQEFQDLVRDLRATEGRRATVRDTPQLVGVHRPLEEIVEMIG
ncbi:MAG: chlorite dismutase family protein [Gemmatimonadota bacterium]|nr:chlorite dismutase family protein [Gemmatimonadota bacterium]